MSKFYCLILLTFLFVSPSFAQEEVSVSSKIKYIKLSAISPSFSYGVEKGLSSKGVLEVEGGLFGRYRFDKYSPIFIEDYPHEAELIVRTYTISPYVNVGYKNYYNIKRRANQNKNVENNAANYFGVSLLGNLDGLMFQKFKLKGEGLNSGVERNSEFSTDIRLYIVPKWGFQRNIKDSRYQYFAEIGPQISSDFEDIEIDIQLQMGVKLRL